MRVITLLTDFGTADAFVGIMKGVILGISPAARLVDLTHEVPPQNVRTAALVLRSAVRFFPPGTIHVAVVDPGVGSRRRPIVIATERGVLVGPDNGLLVPAATAMGQRAVRLIANERFYQQPVSHTFHGRDIFAPVAAHLARGVALEELGPPLDAIVELRVPVPRCQEAMLCGEVVYVDHFGNLTTNIDADALADFRGQPVSVSIGGTPVAGPVTAYSAVPEHTPMAIVGSWGMLEIAVCSGNAATQLAAGPGTPVTVVVESDDA